jgi:hypothetical protein
MEVLRDGNVPPIWKLECFCTSMPNKTNKPKGCNAKLLVGEDDLVCRHWFGTHFRHEYVAFKCPQCDAYTQVVSKNFPNKLKEEILKRESSFDGFDDRI